MDAKKILIIDGNEDESRQLKNFLEREHFDVTLCHTSGEGLTSFREDKPGIVITEILMPLIDGFELVRFMKGSAPGVIIIAMTTGGRIKASEYLHAIRLMGADHTMEKPFRPGELVKAIHSIVLCNSV